MLLLQRFFSSLLFQAKPNDGTKMRSHQRKKIYLVFIILVDRWRLAQISLPMNFLSWKSPTPPHSARILPCCYFSFTRFLSVLIFSQLTVQVSWPDGLDITKARSPTEKALSQVTISLRVVLCVFCRFVYLFSVQLFSWIYGVAQPNFIRQTN